MEPSPTQSETQILLADPDESLLASARRVLERRGLHVTTAVDGDEALARFNPQIPIAILAIALPKRDGLALLRDIKARAPATQIIILTDASSISSAMMGLKEGAFAYILKPIVDYLQLTHAVDTALELHRLRVTGANPPMLIPAPDEPDLSALNRLSNTIHLKQPQDKMLESVMKSAAQIFGASKAVVLLADEANNLQLVAGLGNAGQSPAARDFIRMVGEGFAWRVAKERKSLAVVSPNKKSVHAGAPMIARDRLVGVLIVYEIASDETNAERLAWLQAYAAQAAAAVELGRLGEENARLSPTDSLTGAYKENIFIDMAEREFRRSWRFNESLSLIHVEIQALSAILKRSPELRDQSLRIVSDICRQSVRNIDLVARGKDDSFMLLLLMTDSEGAQIVAERIVRAIRLSPNDKSRGAVRVAVRLGVATYPHEGCTSVMDLLEIARSAHHKVSEPGQDLIGHA